MFKIIHSILLRLCIYVCLFTLNDQKWRFKTILLMGAAAAPNRRIRILPWKKTSLEWVGL